MSDEDKDKNKPGDESDAEHKEPDEDTDTEGGEEDEGSEDSGEGDADDDKPLTRGDLKNFRGEVTNEINKRFAGKRHENKNSRSYKSGDNKSGTDERDSNARLDALEIAENKRQFGHKHGLSPEAVDHIFRIKHNKPKDKDLEDDFIKGGLEALQRKNNVRRNTPSGSGHGSTFKVEGKEWDKMDGNEKQKNFAAKRDEILVRKGRR